MASATKLIATLATTDLKHAVVTPTTEITTTSGVTVPTTPIVRYGKILLRPFCMEDAPLIAAQANNLNVVKYLRNRMPQPYTVDDAVSWLTRSMEHDPRLHYAVCKTDGTFVGAIGLIPGEDVEYRTWVMGYWLGESFWGQGLATDAATAFTRWVFVNFPHILRIEAGVFEGNIGSERVVTKAGFTFEGRRRKAVEKRGEILDMLMFGLLREECLT
jgi:[ribosomal protein S5]-alanine N-acetyltransferase